MALEQDAEHVGVADRAERVPEPAELGVQTFAPVLVQHTTERPQVGAQAPGRDPGLVHALRVVADANDGIVGEETVHRTAMTACTNSVVVARWRDGTFASASIGMTSSTPSAGAIFGIVDTCVGPA